MASAARNKLPAGLQPIRIQVNRQLTGTTYALDGDSRRAIQASFPGVHAAPSVYIATETEDDFERIHGKMWKQIAMVLTGLSTTKLRELGVQLYDPRTRRDLATVY